jgi:1,4-dihydroxy-2-naphthoyl-CoA hydrolase
MSIWAVPFTLEELNARGQGTMMVPLSLCFSAFGDDWLAATMPVGPNTLQPMGLLHGGASLALAETVGSVAGSLSVDPREAVCVGQDINANHVRAVRAGLVTGTARPLHRGRTSQVWGIDITDDAGRLVCIARLTLAVLRKT